MYSTLNLMRYYLHTNHLKTCYGAKYQILQLFLKLSGLNRNHDGKWRYMCPKLMFRLFLPGKWIFILHFDFSWYIKIMRYSLKISWGKWDVCLAGLIILELIQFVRNCSLIYFFCWFFELDFWKHNFLMGNITGGKWKLYVWIIETSYFCVNNNLIAKAQICAPYSLEKEN